MRKKTKKSEDQTFFLWQPYQGSVRVSASEPFWNNYSRGWDNAAGSGGMCIGAFEMILGNGFAEGKGILCEIGVKKIKGGVKIYLKDRWEWR